SPGIIGAMLFYHINQKGIEYTDDVPMKDISQISLFTLDENEDSESETMDKSYSEMTYHELKTYLAEAASLDRKMLKAINQSIPHCK
ncbi:hypothetical protein N9N67_04825, partial [Bacteriovoracaceae bacterium]|nr:hypothetical protein [Bacteriovoracaceae bacterium]